ncbi:hypothetical protein [Actinomycetospora cinnamomea]|uniref:Uncharacterized protein n=1 Tax=Actinomycetospora cinnamomea TaxID=663609 RepID=A0A2U1EWH9_9PSEU|nr:hypothetical protein [Actinomycetospora cinnamomea]PVZ04278.1 hypothetical protein C8D89_11866 [Actinomycetospora cinnamomea]
MDHEPWCPDGAAGCTERTEGGEGTGRAERTARADGDPALLAVGALDAGPGAPAAGGVDWVAALAELDDCDGYVVLAVDPQTGEVDAHGPYPGMGALRAAEDMRETLDREELEDVVVRVVRWHGA